MMSQHTTSAPSHIMNLITSLFHFQLTIPSRLTWIARIQCSPPHHTLLGTRYLSTSQHVDGYQLLTTSPHVAGYQSHSPNDDTQLGTRVTHHLTSDHALLGTRVTHHLTTHCMGIAELLSTVPHVTWVPELHSTSPHLAG